MKYGYSNISLQEAARRAAKIEWYHQGGAVKPFYVGYPWYACSEFRLGGKVIKPHFETIILYKDHFMDVYFSKPSLREVADFYYSRQKRDSNFIARLDKQWHLNYLQPLLQLTRVLQRKGLEELPLRELVRLHGQFSLAYARAWQEIIFLDSFDLYGESLLKQTLEDINADIAPADLDQLVSPPRVSGLQKERLSLLRIVERMKRKAGKWPNGYAKAVRQSPWLAAALAEHSKQYHWLHNDYATTEVLEPSYFYKQTKKLLDSSSLLDKERELRRYLANLAKNQRSIIKKYRLSQDHSKLVGFFGLLGTLRDERKTMTQIVDSVLHDFAAAFSMRTGWDVNLVEHLFWWEVPTVLANPARHNKQIRARLRPFLTWLTKPAHWLEINGKDAERLSSAISNSIKKQSKLTGMTAYPGLVRGKVRIIKTKKDFPKMKRGDILVAPNTRPEYVPIMKMAGAIVSDEGGLTCHSAIVSRELRIPCIVGVQAATATLKDGELIEVDATNGTVKKL